MSLFCETPDARSFSGFPVIGRSPSTPEISARASMLFSPVTPPPPVSVATTPVIQTPVMDVRTLISDLHTGISEIRSVLNANRRASRDRFLRVVSDSPSGASMAGVSPQQTAPPVSVSSCNLSPPHLRSRGRALDLPHVMDKPPEYEIPHQY